MADERTVQLTAEEIAERVRARKARTKYGSMFAVGGFAGGMLAALWFRDFGIASLLFGMAAVGAGFADPTEIKGFWAR